MKTKAEIVQRLLEEKKIDAEEAVTLLMGEEKTVQYIPYPYNPAPIYPLNPPMYPAWPYSFPVMSANSSGNSLEMFSTLQ